MAVKEGIQETFTLGRKTDEEKGLFSLLMDTEF